MPDGDRQLCSTKRYFGLSGSANGPSNASWDQILVQLVSSSILPAYLLPLTTFAAATPTLKPDSTSTALFHRPTMLLETHLTPYAFLWILISRIEVNTRSQGWTAVGGVNWVDVATVEFNKSLTLTYNFAYGGATIDAKLVQPYEPTVLSMTDQVNQFLGSVANKPASTPWTSDNSLFSFWIGINDLGNSYYQSGSRDA